MLEDFNLLEIFWDYDIIVTIYMPSLGYYPALGLYSAGKSKQNIFYFFFQEDQDWGIVAMVLDRLFLWMFAITAISGSLLILSESPYIYDTTSPIDVVFSKIAQQEARIFDEDKLLV